MSSVPFPRRRPIRRLPSQLANQIAAGEVVERPASVVKELVENALDAGARRIEVDIEAGGSRLIRVRDDGGGVAREELALALSRHATSKIGGPEDLAAIASLGFRGEALASIGSVSRLTLTSRPASQECAYRLCSEGHEPAAQSVPAPAAHPPGTSIEVRDLFFNTPARRRFLRTEKTELAHVHDTLKRVALGRFDVRLILRHEQRTLADWRPGNDRMAQERRVRAVFGKGFMDAAVHLELAASGLRAWGWAAQPQFARSQSDLLFLYVNGRPVRDRLLGHAVRQAYQDSLPPGRHPALVLHLELDPAQVDVNVHPTKHEVRFSEGRLVHDFLVHALRQALAAEPPSAPPVAAPAVSGRRAGVRPAISAASGGATVAEQLPVYQALYAPRGRRPDRSADAPLHMPPGATPVAALSVRFLLARRASRLWLIDLTAARLELARADLLAALGEGPPLIARPLLIPANVPVTGAELRGLTGAAETLHATGIVIDAAGPAAVLLRALPPLLAGADPVALVRCLCAALTGREPRPQAECLAGALAPLATFGEAGAAALLSRLDADAAAWAGAARPVDPEQVGTWFSSLAPEPTGAG